MDSNKNNAIFLKIKTYLDDFDPEIKNKVEQTQKNYNALIRNQIRSEIGLKLLKGDKSSSNQIEDDKSTYVMVHTVDTLSDSFIKLVQKRNPTSSFDLFLKMLIKKSLLESTIKGLDFTIQNENDLRDFYYMNSDDLETLYYLSVQETISIQSYIKKIVSFLDQQGLVKDLSNLDLDNINDGDILGAYWIRHNTIEIYWAVIGIIALELGVSVESLTFVVLTHELVHAYTHLGRDIDDQLWDTDAFCQTDLIILEGLAQFYTDKICLNLNSRFPAAHETYLKLLEYQPYQYQAYQGWTDRHQDSAEIIRSCLIECRRKKICEVWDFYKVLDEAKYRFNSSKRL